jgi:hypothetical protein
MRVPKYSEKALRAMLGLTADEAVDLGYRTADGRVWSDAEIEALTRDALSGEWSDDEDDA